MYKMQRLEVSGAVRPIYVSLGVKRLKSIIDWDKKKAILYVGSFTAEQKAAWNHCIDI